MLLEDGSLAGRREGWRWEVDSEALNVLAEQRASERRNTSESTGSQVPRTRVTQPSAQEDIESPSPAPEGGGVARLLELEREKCRILAGEVARLANALAALGISTSSLDERSPEKIEAGREREPWITHPIDVQVANR